jgi:ankyrin repeat protein
MPNAIHSMLRMNLLLISALCLVCAVAHAAPTTKHATIDEAIAKDDLEDVRAHLAANPQSANQGGKPGSRPPLEQAILRNRTRIAIVLIEAGAHPNAAVGASRTPLHLAVERNNPEIASALMKAGAKPNELDRGGWTPLHHAGAKNLPAMARVLLDGGANPMTLSELGGTPLHEAAASGGAEIIRLLLDHKVDPKVKAKDGKTALDIAREFKNQPAIEILQAL